MQVCSLHSSGGKNYKPYPWHPVGRTTLTLTWSPSVA